MSVYLQDADFTLYVGDVREVLAGLEDGCVDCVVTSPPYWGLRDYGTGSWEGGNEDCDHRSTPMVTGKSKSPLFNEPGGAYREQSMPFRDVCGKCGATRQDQQLGLEPTPDQYVRNMVAVFREIRRVLADHGTCWVNLGDSYAGSWGAQSREVEATPRQHEHQAGSNPSTAGGLGLSASQIKAHPKGKTHTGSIPPGSGLKPKDLCGIPWRVAFALQADGWYLRSDIIWAKPNPMPESVSDRPTKAHEYVFLLSKRPRYWFDAEAVREPATNGERFHGSYAPLTPTGPQRTSARNGRDEAENTTAGRNVRSVWEIATQPYPEAHFATYPEELVRRCLLAGCPEWVCGVCGRPRERIVEKELVATRGKANPNTLRDPYDASSKEGGWGDYLTVYGRYDVTTVGWTDCSCASYPGDHPADCPWHQGGTCTAKYRPGVVLDPFLGSGTTAQVARRHGRHCVGIELNPTYAQLAARRLQQLSLLR